MAPLLADLLANPLAALPTFAVAGFVLYVASLVVYRLYLSPLAKFPGDKLAGLSRWYEAYYEIVCHGQFSSKIDEMHEKYGPIVRVAPNELHIRDSSFWDVLYTSNYKVDKDEWASGRFGNDGSILTTANHNLHRRRRASLNPMFSRRAILNFQPVIREHIELLCSKIDEHRKKNVPVNVTRAYPAFSGDIIMQYSFGFSYHHLESTDFKESFHDAFMAVAEFGHVAVQFPWFHPLMNSIPDHITQKMQPALASLLRLQSDLRDLIARTKKGEKLTASEASHPTIFQEVLQSSLPEEDKGNQRIADEAQTIIGGAIETTAFALSVGTFHIVNTPRIYNRLHQDLVQAIPDPAKLPDLLELEKIPYLRACILESVRLSYGISARNPRVFDRPLQYGKWTVPPRTVIGGTIVDVHHDEKIFPDSHTYNPERWLNDAKAPDGKPLEHYFVGFGKGSRSCLGMNLAFAEIYFIFSTIFRRYSFELYETDVTDVKMAHDFFLPSPKLDSKGVRIKSKPVV